ncbi:cold-shock protein [Aureitalea marina]|uniref:Cold-shock protein n=1 Tax=Aureitalea marina TaxID=930804 RepID=A0A2S7KRH3_9FLAO|nr:cold shock domain-containing protein [Aureitalea marina]PQB05216.1 cold-shock protein [Aureitalea marina]
MEGTVKFFNESKGYGFITNDETGQDIFVHVTSLDGQTTLNQGDKVEYSEADGRKGRIATDVKVVNE